MSFLQRNMLKQCRDQFQYYAEQHRQKNTPEGDAKAEINEEMAERCQFALNETEGWASAFALWCIAGIFVGMFLMATTIGPYHGCALK